MSSEVAHEGSKTVQVKTLLVWGSVAVVVIAWIAWWQWDRFVERVSRPLIEQAVAADRGPSEMGAAAPMPGDAADAAREPAESRWEAFTGTPAVWPADFASPRNCSDVEQELMQVCRTLDEREYVGARLQSGGLCTLLREVSEDLAARPPTIASELKDPPAMLGNVFHLFRSIGLKRLLLLREIIAEESEHQEAMALVFYRWLASREKCASDGGSDVTLDRMYDYAGFLTQTMGGQAYLRRRAPSTEALASFYSLVILDRAVEEGINPHGIDVRPELARCRQLVEASEFVFGERYRELLDRMAERWDERTGQ